MGDAAHKHSSFHNYTCCVLPPSHVPIISSLIIVSNLLHLAFLTGFRASESYAADAEWRGLCEPSAPWSARAWIVAALPAPPYCIKQASGLLVCSTCALWLPSRCRRIVGPAHSDCSRESDYLLHLCLRSWKSDYVSKCSADVGLRLSRSSFHRRVGSGLACCVQGCIQSLSDSWAAHWNSERPGYSLLSRVDQPFDPWRASWGSTSSNRPCRWHLFLFLESHYYTNVQTVLGRNLLEIISASLTTFRLEASRRVTPLAIIRDHDHLLL